MGIQDKDKRICTIPNELHNEEVIKVVFKGTGLKALYQDQEPKSVLNNKTVHFGEADLHKAYDWAQGNDDETLTIARRSRHIGRKL